MGQKKAVEREEIVKKNGVLEKGGGGREEKGSGGEENRCRRIKW